MLCRFGIMFFGLLMMVGCVATEEIARIKSPDGLVEAVVTRSSAGATTSFAYKLYLVPTGGGPINKHERLIADHVEGFEVRWKEPKLLEITYREARIFHFVNSWASKELQNFRYVVELRLSPQSDTFSLSPDDRRLNY